VVLIGQVEASTTALRWQYNQRGIIGLLMQVIDVSPISNIDKQLLAAQRAAVERRSFP
jgi:hypothetical protein